MLVSSSLVAEQDEVQQHFSSSPSSAFYTSLPGLIVVTTTACLSALCSGVIIIVILRSRSGRLASIYNRIMFFMSISDVLASAAIALTTLMMPKDLFYTNIYPEIWPIYGTEATCSAQGFIFQTFSFLTFSCDVILCIYYLCSIKLGVSDKVFSLRIEWILYFLALLVILPKSGNDLVQGNFNPSPERARCNRQAYPIDCHGDGCTRGEKTSRWEMVFWTVNLVFMFAIPILCLGLTVFHVYRKDQSSIEEHDAAESGSIIDISPDAPMPLSTNSSIVFANSGEEQEDPRSTPKRSYYTNSRTAIEGTFNRRAKRYEDTKVIMKQAVAYVSVYIVMGVLMILSVSPNLLRNSVTFGVIHAVIRPSHGTLNMTIFLYHKYSNVRKHHHQVLTCCGIFGKIFRGESEDLATIVETVAPAKFHDAIRNVERLKGEYPIDGESEL